MFSHNNKKHFSLNNIIEAAADPRFPVGGGAPISDVGAFWQKHMQKRKN